VVSAKLVGTDPETDIAVLKVDAANLTALPLSDPDELRVGDFVVAVGNPFGLGQTVTSGIVSALGRSGLGIEGYEDFIQTDASINPGNSGGALVNLNGELVGINTAILSQSGGNVGIGFAIPINMARQVTEQLVEHGEVRRGELGVHAQNLTPDLAEAFGLEPRNGAVVTMVERGSPADDAGLERGDVITHVDGEPVTNAADVRNRVGLIQVGQEVELRVLRDGEPLTLTPVLKRPEPLAAPGEALHPRLAGTRLGNIVQGMPMYGEVEGVAVLQVQRGSPAQQAGLRRGDVITQANRQPVADLKTLRDIASGSDALLLNVQRGNQAFFLMLR
ncbi:MAG TPA: PDZ domain-containing protein, partial [Gammaproteobacteria bacterium]|nr:PDZ domain-containing protein [Gammaproteobacteria bacterium]